MAMMISVAAKTGFAILTFLRSLGGSFKALITRAAAEGTTEQVACLQVFNQSEIPKPGETIVNTSVTAFSAPVLNPQLHRDLKTFPVGGGLGNVVTDLLRGKTKGTDLTRFDRYDCQLECKLLNIHLGSEGAGSTNFSSHSPQVDELHLDRDKMSSNFQSIVLTSTSLGSNLGPIVNAAEI